MNKKILFLVVSIVILLLVFIFIYKGIYKGFQQLDTMKGVFASNLSLPELKGVKVNLLDVFERIYTCDGDNINPQIVFPDNGVYAVIVEDPDAPAGTWFHWGIIIWDSKEIPEGLPKVLKGDKYYQVYNDFYYYNFTRGNIAGIGYDGPCPPPGHGYHRYFFEVFKLKRKPESQIVYKDDLLEFIKENAESVYIFVARYKR